MWGVVCIHADGINAVPSLAAGAKARVSLIIGRRAALLSRPVSRGFKLPRSFQWAVEREGGGGGTSARAKVYARMICSRFLIPLINPLSLIIAFLSRSFFVALDRAPRCAPAARAVVPPGNSIPAAFFCFDGEQWAGRSFYALSGLAKRKRAIDNHYLSGRYLSFFFWPVIEFREG